MNENTTDIWNVYKTTRSMDSRNALVERYLPLLRGTVRRMYPVCRSSWEAEDIYQCAALGLISAVESYEEGHGAAFETYASSRMRGAVLDFMRRGSLIHIPRSMEGRDMPRLFSLDELSEDGGLDELSLDLSPSPEERVIQKEERERLERAVRSLPLNEYAVIAGVYFNGRTLESVSRCLGLSRSRAWQLKKSALARLKGMLGDA